MRMKALSPEVLYDSLTVALNGNAAPPVVVKNPKGLKIAQPTPYAIGPRDEFLNFFAGPAVETAAEEYSHGIPQVLRLMNAAPFNARSPLAESLASVSETTPEKIDTLCLAVLSRRPTADERQTLAEYVEQEGANARAFSGAIWVLLNTSEFLVNR